MRPFNDFLKTNFDAARRFVVFDVPTAAVPAIKPEATAIGYSARWPLENNQQNRQPVTKRATEPRPAG